MTDLPAKANISTIAEHLGMSRDKAGRLLRGAGLRRINGKYDTAKALAVLTSLTDLDVKAGNLANGRGKGAALDGDMGARVASLAEAKALSETLRAEKLRQQIDVQQGKLIPRADVIALAKDVGAHVRTNVLAVPAKVAADCLGKDADAIQRILTDALRDALIRLTDTGDYLLGTTTT